ncbi:MAG: hypothetical protein MUO76_07635 [Anaerolineaceae bacterium]|nr:hypothetical protein [Anaerolineaceae bacterium]
MIVQKFPDVTAEDYLFRLEEAGLAMIVEHIAVKRIDKRTGITGKGLRTIWQHSKPYYSA